MDKLPISAVEAKVEQFFIEWLNDDAVRAHWTHQLSLLLTNQWQPYNQPPSPVPKPLLPSARTHSSSSSPVNQQAHQSMLHNREDVIQRHQRSVSPKHDQQLIQKLVKNQRSFTERPRSNSTDTSEESSDSCFNRNGHTNVSFDEYRSEKKDAEQSSFQTVLSVNQQQLRREWRVKKQTQAASEPQASKSSPTSLNSPSNETDTSSDGESLSQLPNQIATTEKKLPSDLNPSNLTVPSSDLTTKHPYNEGMIESHESNMQVKSEKLGIIFPPLLGAEEPVPLEIDLIQEVSATYLDEGEVSLDDLQLVCRVCGLASFFAADMMYACAVSQKLDVVNREVIEADDIMAGSHTNAAVSDDHELVANLPSTIPSQVFLKFWEMLTKKYPTAHSKAMYLLNPVGNSLNPGHFRRLVHYVILVHPGLDFLRDAPEYQPRYVDTVIARIFYTVNRSWSREISNHELRRGSFLSSLAYIDSEYNINKETQYFSYEHFYVIYTTFWKLDGDHDLHISQAELAEYNDGGHSPLVLERIFSNTVFAHPTSTTATMAYWDFIFFMLSEEDKATPRAIEYWFRIMDLDGDGLLSFYELEQFYNEQLLRLEELAVEALPFVDVLCMSIDMVSPRQATFIRLSDLKRCGLAPRFFNTFTNVNKYLDQEESEESDFDDDEFSSIWHRFASREYILLSSEDDDHSDADNGGGDYGNSSPHSPLVHY